MREDVMRAKNHVSIARFAVLAYVLLAAASFASGADSALTAGKPVKIADGFGAIEGPAWDRKGTLYFSSLGDGKIHRWSKAGGATLFQELEGGCNGLRFDGNGNLLVCQPRARRVLRITPTGRREIVVDRHEGGRLNSPNDLWVAPDGGTYF
ncbi:MAG: SMP-30/gluconolactonase/LRE family protein, partial [Planctomycetales bacterium]